MLHCLLKKKAEGEEFGTEERASSGLGFGAANQRPPEPNLVMRPSGFFDSPRQVVRDVAAEAQLVPSSGTL